MKTSSIIVLSALIGLSPGLSTSNLAAIDETGITARISRARQSRDIKEIIAASRDLEKLWPQQPTEYFRGGASLAAALEPDAGTNSEARRALLAVFDGVLQKTCPADTEEALACFDLKQSVVLTCLPVVQASGGNTRVLALAQFIGQVRSRIILNYNSEGSSLPPGIDSVAVNANEPFAAGAAPSDPGARAAHDKLMEEHQRVLLTNKLQSLLARIDASLTSRLLAIASQLSGPGQGAFVEKLSSAARLTEDERKKL